MINGVTLAKDTIGFVGTCFAIVPWFRDFIARVRRGRIDKFPVGESLRDLRDKLHTDVESWLNRPKLSDFLLMIGGLLLVALSFLIGAVQSLSM